MSEDKGQKEDDEERVSILTSSSSNQVRVEGSTKLYLSSLVMLIGAICTGLMLGFSSPFIPSIQNDDSSNSIHIDDNEATWIGSLVTLGAMTGGFLAGFLLHQFGRKFTAIISSVPYVGGLLLLAYANSVVMLYVGRFITGLGTGITSLVVPTYISEISPPHLRGLLGSGNQLAIVIGIFLVYVLGGALTWRWLALVAAVFPTLFAAACLFIPETPRYLFAKGKRLEAVEALLWLRGAEADCSREIHDMEVTLSTKQDEASWREIFVRSQYLKPLLLSLALMIFQQFSGVNCIMFYLETIFKTAGFSSPSQLHMASLLVAGMQIIATAISCAIVDRAGRKVLLVISTTTMTVSLVAFGLYFELTKHHDKPQGYLSWLSLASLMVFIVSFSFGLGPIPWFMSSEMTPQRARSKCGGLTTLVNYLGAFITTKEFSDLEAALTSQGTFWMFGGICALACVFTLFLLPETKGKSLEEIERYFAHGRGSDGYESIG